MLTLWIILLGIQGILLGVYLVSPWKSSIRSFLNHHTTVAIGAPLLRLGFAWMFFSACHPKIMSPYGFAELVAQYQMLPQFSVNFFSLWLPIFELLVGAGLILTKWNKEFSTMVFLMLLMFIIALAQTLVRDLAITCGCFDIEGAMDKNDAWSSMLRDLALIGPIVWLWIKGKNKYIWDFKS